MDHNVELWTFNEEENSWCMGNNFGVQQFDSF